MKIKVKDFYNEFYEAFQVANHKEHTVDTRRGIFKNHILPSIGNMSIANVFPSDINAIYLKMEKNAYKQNTLFGVYSALGSIFKLAMEKNFIKTNPMKKARTIQAERF